MFLSIFRNQNKYFTLQFVVFLQKTTYFLAQIKTSDTLYRMSDVKFYSYIFCAITLSKYSFADFSQESIIIILSSSLASDKTISKIFDFSTSV